MKKKLSTRPSWLAELMAGGFAFLVLGAILLPQTASGQISGEKVNSSAVLIEPVRSEGVVISPEFRVAIYENLVEEVSKTGEFQHVYRSGDRRATDVQDLLILRTRVESFKRGSQKKREVTTVAGATIIKTEVQLVTRDGHMLVDQQVEGKVRLFGENLKATHDLAKKVARLIRSATDQRRMNAPSD